jgi:hypothetical protein
VYYTITIEVAGPLVLVAQERGQIHGVTALREPGDPSSHKEKASCNGTMSGSNGLLDEEDVSQQFVTQSVL